ncbi:hypothetical protein GCM10009740_39660 [Terrabacter terrae]|uniref:Uncharacterized protein n=1 Tax=Terrabacter terrae TaxID=318434 RepID=A0ABN1ZTX3_9MICO
MDLPLRVAPEVRLRSSTSGLRAVLVEGPSATGVGARPTAAGDGKEGRGAAAQLVDLERRARTAQETDDVHALQSVEEALTSLHLQNHPLRRRPDSPAPTALPAKEREMLERKALRAAQPPISVFKRAARSKARALAETEADHFVRTLDVAHSLIAQHRVAVLDDQWHALADHERCAVIAELDAEFAAAESCCTCVDAGWDPDTSRSYVTVVARYPGPDLVAERGPGASANGRGMLRRRTPVERNALYLKAIASFALGTVRRVISVAVAVDDLHLLVVRTPEAATGLEPVYLGLLTREDVTLRPPLADPVPMLLAAAVRPLQFDGPADDLVALAPDPAVLAVVERCAEALEDHAIDSVLEGTSN